MLRRSTPAVLAEALPFQESLEEIVNAAAPNRLRLTGALAASLLLALLLTASVCSVDIVVEGVGHLEVDAPTILLQPLERAILRGILVKPGDRVAKGQVLATLDPTFSQADRVSLLAQQRALRAAMMRIDAELSEKQFVGNSTDPDIALQISLYQQHQAQLSAHLRSLDEEIGRDVANLKVTQAEADLLARELATAKNIEAIRGALLATQNGSRLTFLDAEAASMRTERDSRSALGRLADLHHSIDAKLAEREFYIGQWRASLIEELARDRMEITKVEDNLAKAERLHDLVRLTAPSDAVVLEVAHRSDGSVVREAEPLVSLLPSDAPLIADVRIASADIGYLHPGDEVFIRIDAFPFQRHGTLRGHLRAIGQQSMAAETMSGPDATRSGAESSQRAQIIIDSEQGGHLTDGSRPTPGMTVTAELKVGSRSVIAYFLSPITKGFDDSLHEP